MADERWLFPPEGMGAYGHEYLWSGEKERLAHERWMQRPLAERTAVFRARVGLIEGDLRHLAALIRDGFLIDADIAADLADAIEGPNSDGYCLKLALAKGHKSPGKKAQIAERNFDIYWRVLLLRMAARNAGEQGVSDSIFAQVASDFGVKVSTVKSAWRARSRM